MKIVVSLLGCDETTEIELDVGTSEVGVLNKLVRESARVREENYMCYPILKWREL